MTRFAHRVRLEWERQPLRKVALNKLLQSQADMTLRQAKDIVDELLELGAVIVEFERTEQASRFVHLARREGARAALPIGEPSESK